MGVYVYMQIISICFRKCFVNVVSFQIRVASDEHADHDSLVDIQSVEVIHFKLDVWNGSTIGLFSIRVCVDVPPQSRLATRRTEVNTEKDSE